MKLSALFSPCLLGHQDRVRERDDQGKLVLVCPACRHVQRPEMGETMKLPTIKVMKAKKVKRSKPKLVRRVG